MLPVLSNAIISTKKYLAHSKCRNAQKKEHPPEGRMFYHNVYYWGDVLYSIHGEGAFL